MFAHLKQLFVYDFQDNFLVKRGVGLLYHTFPICTKDLRAKLCQKLWICLKRYLAHQQEDFHQRQFEFHELLITTEQYMSLLVKKPDWEGVKSLLLIK